MARLRVKYDDSDEYISGEISLRRAQANLHLIYCKVFKENANRVKKYVGIPPWVEIPEFAGVPDFVKNRMPKIPKTPPGLDMRDYGEKSANEARLESNAPSNPDLVHIQVLT